MGAELDVEGRAKLVDALARGLGPAAASRFSGISRGHVYRLKADPEFVAQVEKARSSLGAEPGPAELPEAERRSLAVLAEVRDDPEELGAVRVQAAKAILGYLAAKAPRKPVAASAQPRAAAPPEPTANDPGARESVVKLLARAEAERAGRPAC